MRDRYDDDWYRRDRYRDDDWRRRGERGPIARGTDEVRSWFGDEDAERRRRVLDGDRDRDDRGWRDRQWSDRDWPDRRGTQHRDDGDDRNYRRQSWGAESWADNDYGYSPSYRPGWRSDYSRDWRDEDRERGWRDRDGGRGWRGDYLGSYGSDDAPSRVGGYAGRGPKGYQRADARIHEDVSDRLADSPDVDATDIAINVSNGEVTLSGTVRDRWQKHRAEDIAEETSGVREVHNQLRVNRETAAANTTTTAPTVTTSRR